MQNLVLYRKYRPKAFKEVIGQEFTVQTLRYAVALQLISHAYLFSGPRGSGKTTLARILAKALNCKNPNQGEPCNACDCCQEINRGNALDLIEIDAASNRGIDEIRDLKDGIRFAPSKLKYRVFVIDEAHQLTKEAANALLKTLEEPPSHAIFILCTTELHRMIPTIVSRCQRFDFRKLTGKEIITRLKLVAEKEGVKISQPALQLIACNSGGSLRDAESLLDKVFTFHLGFSLKGETEIQLGTVKELLGIVDIAMIGEFVDFLLEKKVVQALELLQQSLEKGMDPQEFIKSLLQYVRQNLILKINPAVQNPLFLALTSEQEETMKQQSARFALEHLRYIIENFMEAEKKMKYASIIQLPLELAIIDSCGTKKETQ